MSERRRIDVWTQAMPRNAADKFNVENPFGWDAAPLGDRGAGNPQLTGDLAEQARLTPQPRHSGYTWFHNLC